MVDLQRRSCRSLNIGPQQLIDRSRVTTSDLAQQLPLASVRAAECFCILSEGVILHGSSVPCPSSLVLRVAGPLTTGPQRLAPDLAHRHPDRPSPRERVDTLDCLVTDGIDALVADLIFVLPWAVPLSNGGIEPHLGIVSKPRWLCNRVRRSRRVRCGVFAPAVGAAGPRPRLRAPETVRRGAIDPLGPGQHRRAPVRRKRLPDSIDRKGSIIY